MIGIYKITNNINHKVYIGQSINIERRWACHKNRAFVPNKEYDKYLYRAFRKYGIENFSFKVLEECSKEELDEKEKQYILEYHSCVDTYGYNETCGYDSPQYGVSGEQHPNHKLSAEEVYYIRECYNSHLKKEDVYAEFSDRISPSGFHKVWLGETWKDVHIDVYTEENQKYYLFQRNSHPGSSNGRSKLTEEMVIDIRTRKKNGEKMLDVYQEYKSTGITEGSFKNTWHGYNWKNIQV